tara:strand:+ start:278 stop:502 length:225 start_codon:yes stop_codon:yes gene_type:complete
MLDIKIIEINVSPNEVHLGILRKICSLPVIVQSAIAIIIEAKNNIRISFKLHNINMEMIKVKIDNKLVGFNFNN